MSVPKKQISDAVDRCREYFDPLVKNHDIEGEIVSQSPVWIRATILGLMGSAVFGLGWLGAKTDEVITVTGKLEPLGSVKNIQMPVGGIAAEILVEEGEEVVTGQIVMKLDAETSQKRLSTLIESEKLKTTQLNLKKDELESYLLKNSEEIKTLTRSLELQNTYSKN